MTRPLRVMDGAAAHAVLLALRAALSGDGPAVLPAAAPLGEAVETRVPRRVALVIETSGSTGTPKRVALSTDALLASAAASAAALGGAGQWLLALPTHYIAGAQVLVRSIVAETEPVILPAGHFDPLVFAEHAARMDAPLRFVSLVPVQLARVVEAAEADTVVLAAARRFDRILVGGQATPPALIARAEALGLRVTRTYGSSETAGGCVYNGVPLHGTRLHLEGVPGDGGLIELGGPMLAEGYLAADGSLDAERTASAFTEHHGDRRYRTGDLGELVDGRLRVLGRSDNVIISGGEKVSLEAVERVLHGQRGFESAVAVALADPVWGQAIVVARADAADTGDGADLERVRAAVAAALGPAARPRALHTVAELPQLPSGKLDRAALARLIAADGARTRD
ncbi:AMP-binding protein [Microterricola viridarii]|uniref:O-succinylbenzoic acid--CoA ligase n=1 Tax=Microterricola viridarii TaxID=412690 RepID=A0A1H1MY18_9MICO|nr:AMP-binding protein [Microterricola viridarii]SDR91570.1 O-succinylbenzoic acid--CoA ligase [Microterricola viridarii]